MQVARLTYGHHPVPYEWTRRQMSIATNARSTKTCIPLWFPSFLSNTCSRYCSLHKNLANCTYKSLCARSRQPGSMLVSKSLVNKSVVNHYQLLPVKVQECKKKEREWSGALPCWRTSQFRIRRYDHHVLQFHLVLIFVSLLTGTWTYVWSVYRLSLTHFSSCSHKLFHTTR